jgi:ABC-2 type transport system permease protein
VTDVLHAEWAKLRTARSTLGLLAATVVLTVGIGTAAAATVVCPAQGCTIDATRLSLTGVAIGQATVAILAVLTLAGERSAGMLHLTFAAVPRRLQVLVAKAVLTGALVAVTGGVAVLGSLAAGRLLLPDGVQTVTGNGSLSLADEPVRRAAVGSIAYLILVAWLSLGLAAIVRDPAPAIGIVLGLCYVLPILSLAVNDPDVHTWLQRLSPATAGSIVQLTGDLTGLPIGPWAGLAVVAAWAAAALLIGGIALHRRDA